jgi:hypothetical protein
MRPNLRMKVTALLAAAYPWRLGSMKELANL